MSEVVQPQASVGNIPAPTTESGSRRASRTRGDLMAAFTATLFEKGYDATTVQEVAARASVARSTFYEHFTGKSDILAACMSRFFAVFAECVDAAAPPERLEGVLSHLFENRRLVDAIFTCAPRKALDRTLSSMIEMRLQSLSEQQAAGLLAPAALVSISLAQGQLALIEAWLRGRARCDAHRLGIALHRATHDAAAAFMERAAAAF